jgi:hypothetical protein
MLGGAAPSVRSWSAAALCRFPGTDNFEMHGGSHTAIGSVLALTTGFGGSGVVGLATMLRVHMAKWLHGPGRENFAAIEATHRLF